MVLFISFYLYVLVINRNSSLCFRYLSLIETPCGFNPSFFSLLKDKLSSLPDMDLDFILALDEVGTRKNIAIGPQTLI